MVVHTGSDRTPVLVGRTRERHALDWLLEGALSRRGGSLVLRGEEGMGKSALLEYLVERAAGCRVARAAGVETEIELAFAGLHQLCAPMLDRLERLPGPQKEALGVAFGLTAGQAPDRFLVGLAVLSLFSDVAEERPLVCVVDDAQWLDRASAQALAFAARRLLAESVALAFAVRGGSGGHDAWARLPELVVEGLGDADARALLASVLHGPLDEQVRDRIVAETRGNPLLLLELPRGSTPERLAGGFGLPDGGLLASRLEKSFARRLARLPAATRQLLLVGAAEPLGEPLLVWHAAERLGIGIGAAGPAASAGLAEFGAQVRFRHPLVRSAVYRAASLEERQSVHRALAEVTDPAVDPDRRAWHRAQATPGPDEDVAREVERSAGRARARGGLAAAAAFLQRAAALTAQPARRAQRALAAAEAELGAGAFDAALELLNTAHAGPLDELQRARLDLLRARSALASGRGAGAAPLLLQAARRLEPLDVALARETYLDALSTASFARPSVDGGADPAEVAAAARAAPAARPGRASDLLLHGLVLLTTEGYAAAAPALKHALDGFRNEGVSTEEETRWVRVALRTAELLWQDETWDVVSARMVELTREAGALAVLPIALSSRATIHVLAGELRAAALVIDEADAVADATGSHVAPDGALALGAWRGREGDLSALIQTSIEELPSQGEGIAVTLSQCASAVLYNGLGRYQDALDAAQRAVAAQPIVAAPRAMVELIEAATRNGNLEIGAEALRRLAVMTQASGTDWALGIEARMRALLSDGEAAERLYREAVDRLQLTRVRTELARAYLLYGEWLRRERRHRDAREQLHTAHDMFSAMGAEAFAERARRELQATGETARKRTVETRSELTAQEGQVARLARDGLSNPDIGTRLFISPRTVEYHLHKVYAKLDIGSRVQLEHALSDDPHVAR
jgi:DNA-binding CsgD family transcriptional regulator